MKTSHYTSLLLFSFLSFSCGSSGPSSRHEESQNTASTNSPKNTFAVATAAELPLCEASTSGFIAYILASKKLQACINTGDAYAWSTIDYASRSDLDEFLRKDSLADTITFDDLTLTKTRKIYEEYRRSVYRLALFCSNNTLTGGTGYKCAENSICTNKHVVQGCAASGSNIVAVEIARVYPQRDTIEPYFYRSLPTIITAIPTSLDLAKIQIDPSYLSTDKTFTNATSNTVKTFDQILSMSFPLLLEDLFSDLGYVKVNSIGECNGYADYGCLENVYHFVSSNDTDQGSSGSPLINVESGQVVGLTTAGYGDGIYMNPNIAVSAHLFSMSQYWP